MNKNILNETNISVNSKPNISVNSKPNILVGTYKFNDRYMEEVFDFIKKCHNEPIDTWNLETNIL